VLGQEIGGKYRIERLIGQGGMGLVFEATHLRLRQRVAIKTLLPEVLEVPELVTRFEREARAAAQLKGPNSARILDVSETDAGLPYMVMEYLEGNDLADELERRDALPIPEALHLLIEAARAVEDAHRHGIIHRDLKPSNLFLAVEGATRVVKLLDFGISKLSSEDANNVTQTRSAIGTPLYMSPEQVRSAKNVDERTDIWSLGVILYEVLAGSPPFDGPATRVGAAIVSEPPPSLREARPEVSEALEAIVLRALEKRPENRYPSATAFIQELSGFLGLEAPEPSARSAKPPSGAPTSARASAPASAPATKEADERAETLAQAISVKAGGQRPATATDWSAPPKARSARSSLYLGFAVAIILGVALLLKFNSHLHSAAPDAPSLAVTAPPSPATASSARADATNAVATAVAPTALTPAPPTPSVGAPTFAPTARPIVASPGPTHTLKPISQPPPKTAPTAESGIPNRL
jgi:serine/threonine-protein kinase